MRSVYLLKEDENQYYKIGISKNTKRRIKQLQTGSAGEISLHNEFISDYASKIEKALHRKYNTYKVKGEWFNLTLEQVKAFLQDCQIFEANFMALDESSSPYHEEYQRRSSH
jgi:predicted GIY-YIG superfamily endonuclease